MIKLHIVWDVHKAIPKSRPMLYGDASKLADALERATHRTFMVLDAPNEPSPAI